MYHAKRSGKNMSVVFDPSMHATGPRPVGAPGGPGPGRGPRRVLPELPAVLRPGRRTSRRVRGADPLGPPHPRSDLAGRVHPARRGNGSHPPDRRLGAARGVSPSPAVAGGPARRPGAQHQRQRLRPADSRTRSRRQGRFRAARDRARSRRVSCWRSPKAFCCAVSTRPWSCFRSCEGSASGSPSTTSAPATRR